MDSIHEVARRLQINANAIRFYEKKGLVHPVRGENQYRVYGIEEISRLETIVVYRKMGFSVEAIRQMMEEEKEGKLLEIFAKQYQLLNDHIHTLIAIRDTIGSCVEVLLENPEGSISKNEDKTSWQEKLLQQMEETAKMTQRCSAWKDSWNFDSWAQHYDEDIRIPGAGLDFYKNYNLVIEKTAAKVLETGGKVVEIGIGTGNLAKTIYAGGKYAGSGLLQAASMESIGEEAIRREESNKVTEYIGIDQSINMLKMAREKCPDHSLKLRRGTYLQLPLESNTYDVVVSSYAFHHCEGEEKKLAVMEMDRILRSKGSIVITDLMFENQNSREKFAGSCSKEEKADLEDEFFANVDELEGILSDCGYQCFHEQIDRLVWMVTGEK